MGARRQRGTSNAWVIVAYPSHVGSRTWRASTQWAHNVRTYFVNLLYCLRTTQQYPDHTIPCLYYVLTTLSEKGESGWEVMSVVRMGSVTEAWQEHRNGENVANCGYVQYLHRSVDNTVHCCRSMNGIHLKQYQRCVSSMDTWRA